MIKIDGIEFKNVKQLRSFYAQSIGDKFLNSGVEYTCIGVVLNYTKDECNRIANAVFESGNNFSKSRYLPVMNMSNMLSMDVAKYVHNQLHGKKV